MRDAERRVGNQRKTLFLWILRLCKVEICVQKKSNCSYLSKLFEILLHILHYRVGRQAAHKYFLCSCDHLEKKEGGGRGGDGERRGLQMRRAVTLMRLQKRRVNLHLPREANRQEATHPHKCG